jgi:nicotinamidase/pyrazinamidase
MLRSRGFDAAQRTKKPKTQVYMKKKYKTALILVDLQNDFFPGGALAVKSGDEIIPIINRLLKCPFDYVIATKDWHPINHGSFAVNHDKQPGDYVMLAGVDQILWPVHCVQNTEGAEFAPGWDTSRVDCVFCKGTDKDIDSYSTFFDNGRRKSTGLDKSLEDLGIKHIVIAGLATDYCVKYSVLDGIQLGFDTFVVLEGCRGVNLKKADADQALNLMKDAGANLVTIEDIETNLLLITAKGTKHPNSHEGKHDECNHSCPRLECE